MSCRICGINIPSNRELRLHLLIDHKVTLTDYYSYNPKATRYCSKCKRELPTSEFYVDRHNISGYRTQCIRCIHPKGNKSECPLCHRLFQESGAARHLKRDHGISLLCAYSRYLKGKRCPRCKTFKPLRAFYLKRNGTYFPYCKNCNSARKKCPGVSSSVGTVLKAGEMVTLIRQGDSISSNPIVHD